MTVKTLTHLCVSLLFTNSVAAQSLEERAACQDLLNSASDFVSRAAVHEESARDLFNLQQYDAAASDAFYAETLLREGEKASETLRGYTACDTNDIAVQYSDVTISFDEFEQDIQYRLINNSQLSELVNRERCIAKLRPLSLPSMEITKLQSMADKNEQLGLYADAINNRREMNAVYNEVTNVLEEYWYDDRCLTMDLSIEVNAPASDKTLVSFKEYKSGVYFAWELNAYKINNLSNELIVSSQQ